MSRAKNWCLTINNPLPAERLLLPNGLPPEIGYFVYQIERGADGTEHVQGYVQFREARRLGWIKRFVCGVNEHGQPFLPFARAHLEVARGTAEQAAAYCKKVDTRVAGPYELGFMSSQGARSDLAKAYSDIVRTGDWTAGGEEISLKYASGCIKAAARFPPPRRDDLTVITLVGTTGIGKTHTAWANFPNLYSPYYGNSGLWWDGYERQEVVLLEEFRGQVPLQKLLQVLDPYPLRLEVKGGITPAFFRLVIITSNTSPTDWYPDKPGQITREPERQALARRLGMGIPGTALAASPRYIEASSRAELAQKFNLALAVVPIAVAANRGGGALPPAAAPAAQVPIVAAAAAPVVDVPINVDDIDKCLDELTRTSDADRVPQPAADPSPVAAAAATSTTPIVDRRFDTSSPGPEPPALKRQNASVRPPSPSPAPDSWIPPPSAQDLYQDQNGDYHVSDDILKDWL